MYLVTYLAKGPRHEYPDLILRSGYPYRGPSYDMAKGPPVQYYMHSTVLEGLLSRAKASVHTTTYVMAYTEAKSASAILYILYNISLQTEYHRPWRRVLCA